MFLGTNGVCEKKKFKKKSWQEGNAGYIQPLTAYQVMYINIQVKMKNTK